jgi:uncharacterized membrane protein YvbJ
MNETNTLTKKEDEIYCPNCGKPISKNAVVCLLCGVQVKPLSVNKEEKPSTAKTVGNSLQAIGIILTIFITIPIIILVMCSILNK